MQDATPERDLCIIAHFDAQPDSVYRAINDVRGWWGQDIIGVADKVDGEFTFTHKGLVPAFLCYEKCSGAWAFLVNNSLVPLVTTRKGNPIVKDQAD